VDKKKEVEAGEREAINADIQEMIKVMNRLREEQRKRAEIFYKAYLNSLNEIIPEINQKIDEIIGDINRQLDALRMKPIPDPAPVGGTGE
jgi:uncharacterized FlaG/YvyC family protein